MKKCFVCDWKMLHGKNREGNDVYVCPNCTARYETDDSYNAFYLFTYNGKTYERHIDAVSELVVKTDAGCIQITSNEYRKALFDAVVCWKRE